MRVVQQWTKIRNCDSLHFSLMILMVKHPIFHKYLIPILYILLKVGLPVLLQCVNTGDLKVLASIVLWIPSPAHSYW